MTHFFQVILCVLLIVMRCFNFNLLAAYRGSALNHLGWVTNQILHGHFRIQKLCCFNDTNLIKMWNPLIVV